MGRVACFCHQRLHARPFTSEMLNFLEVCSYWKSQAASGAYAKIDNQWGQGPWLGRTHQTPQGEQFSAQAIQEFVGPVGPRKGHKKYRRQLDCSRELRWCHNERMYITKAPLDEYGRGEGCSACRKHRHAAQLGTSNSLGRSCS